MVDESEEVASSFIESSFIVHRNYFQWTMKLISFFRGLSYISLTPIKKSSFVLPCGIKSVTLQAL